MTTSDRIEVAAGNEEQYVAWNGDEGEQWAAHPEFYDASVRNLQKPLMEAAGIGPDDRVLDVGCGNGQCTRQAARRAVDGTALGIDLSQQMWRKRSPTGKDWPTRASSSGTPRSTHSRRRPSTWR